MMKSQEIRHSFVEYFRRHNHTPVSSSSLIPDNDPTLLFANAGMNQFKNTFLGLENRNYKRAVSVQKCVRAGGKHNDLENVGFTARHHTFFEMLGNFSFGDYFKKEAIHFAWELLTKELQIPKEKLYITVYETDDEAAEIWHKQEGIPRDRIFRFEKDNFWRMGDTGPCGPSTEIFYDHGPKAGKESDPYKGIAAGEDRFVEIWNLVFMQFFEKSPGVMDPLPKPSVDTGSGLERVVAALQGKFNNYDTDLFFPMIEKATTLSGCDYVTDLDVLQRQPKVAEVTSALRVLADHSRAVGFLIADGASPSNEGRGYVLRRILRRAIRYGRKISESHSLFPAMVESLIHSMSSVYPELEQRRGVILSTVKEEEARFLSTLDQGTEILNEELKKLKGGKVLSGEVAFRLYDTFGFPVDLTRLMASEQNISVDEAGFEKMMESARQKAKSSWKGHSITSDEAHLIQWTQKSFESSKETHFTGYETMASAAQILSLSNGQKEVSSLKAGESGFVLLDRTPFYAEGGGQVGDEGELKSPSARAHVSGCKKQNSVYVHEVQIIEGALEKGQKVEAAVHESLRRNTMANHSATHLMHSALRQVLGPHVSQAGSIVDPQRLRFDFTHNKPLSEEEIAKIEALVNEQIGRSLPVSVEMMSHEKAIASGAMALFGEKYGAEVRVLRMGDFSSELCGGTHVSNTSQIRVFKVLSEGGVSAGVRRIEALTGEEGLRYLLLHTKENLKARHHAGLATTWSFEASSEKNKSELCDWIDSKKEEIKSRDREIKKLQGAQIDVQQLTQQALIFNTKSGASAKLLTADLGLDDREVLAQITDQLKNKIQSGIVVVVGKGETSHPIIVSVSKDLLTEFKAGEILKDVASIMGGKGGGRPDFAQGAAPDRAKIRDAFAKVRSHVNIVSSN